MKSVNTNLDFTNNTITNIETIVSVSGASTLSYLGISTTVNADTSGAGFTTTLPTGIGNTGYVFNLRKESSDTNVWTIDTTGGETINGSLTISLSIQYNNVTVQFDGSNWIILQETSNTVKSYQLSYTGQISSTTQGLFKASINDTGTGVNPTTSVGNPGFNNGAVDPILIPVTCTLTRIRIKFAQAAVGTGTVGTPTVRMVVYRVDSTSRTIIGTVDVAISATGVQTFNNLGVTSSQTAESSLLAISLSAGDLIGLQFTNQSGTNDGINAIGRLFAVLTTVE